MFKVNTNFKSPALFFSGGVESTLLYYLYGQTNVPLTLYLINRRNNPILHAVNIYNKLDVPFKKTLVIEPIPEMESYKEIPFLYNTIKSKHDMMIYGGNKLPDDNSIRPMHKQSYINEERIRNDQYAYAPFLDLDKSAIIQMYYTFGIEYLLEETHSCGENTSVPCKSCFNCREREWAFNKINKQVIWGR